MMLIPCLSEPTTLLTFPDFGPYVKVWDILAPKWQPHTIYTIYQAVLSILGVCTCSMPSRPTQVPPPDIFPGFSLPAQGLLLIISLLTWFCQKIFSAFQNCKTPLPAIRVWGGKGILAKSAPPWGWGKNFSGRVKIYFSPCVYWWNRV